MNLPTVIAFDPARWGEIERFARFYSSTYAVPENIRHCISGTASHFHRAAILKRIAFSMIGAMRADRLEFEAKGFSQNAASADVAAVVESAIMSLYASIDTARKIVTHIFSRCRGLPDSTRKTFKAATDGTIDERVPEQIRAAFKNADWYPRLRRIRDALTHTSTGSCHLDLTTGQVAYYHDALSDGNKVLNSPDIFGELEKLFGQVNRFLGQVFSSLNQTLKDEEVWQMCGIFGGRIYSRFVRLSEAVDFNSGRCEAHSWFDLPGNPRCPFADTCGAYQSRQTAPSK